MEEFIRQDILLSARGLLLEQGFGQFTMDRVAAQAGMAKGTVYLYYKNKSELLNAVLDHAYEPLQRELHQILERDEAPLAILEQYAVACLEHSEENRLLLRELRTVLFATMDERISDRRSWYWTLAGRLGEVLERGAAQGVLRKANWFKVASIFIDAINGLMSHRILGEVGEGIEQDVQLVLGIHLDGLRPRPA